MQGKGKFSPQKKKASWGLFLYKKLSDKNETMNW